MPLPSASTPQRSHVSGMNCIHPTAPAELGPMFRPKFDSILLIAASTCQGIPYVPPARCQSVCSAGKGRPADEPGTRYAGGTTSEPGAFGACAPTAAGVEGTTVKTGGDAAAAP